MNQSPLHRAEDSRNMTIAFVLCAVVIGLWQYFYAIPEQKRMLEQQKQVADTGSGRAPEHAKVQDATPGKAVATAAAQKIDNAPKIAVKTPVLEGYISSRGLRFSQLILTEYRETLRPNSEPVTLLSPDAGSRLYFAEFGWLGESGAQIAGNDALWQANSDSIAPGQPAVFTYSKDGLTFTAKVEIEDNYLFKITRSVQNNGTNVVVLHPYGIINRGWEEYAHFAILHEGPLGVFDGILHEVNYDDLEKEHMHTFSTSNGWFGATDKYWLSAIFPEKDTQFTARFNYAKEDGIKRVQTDYLKGKISLGAGESKTVTDYFFAGPKEISLLDKYANQYQIPLFDRAVDLGVLYFLTKPIFLVLKFFHSLLGNFGLAILLLTVCIKILLFPLSFKSQVSMNAMKELQPDVEKIKERCGDDKMLFNKEVMQLYKREKVNPLSGCLPLLIQIPIFFALYKVLFVTIEMRHAPFYGWIHDLSAMDPTNIFNLFGLIAWNPPAVLHVGIWPIIMCVTMVIQQSLNPKPADPVQAKIINLMPYFFLILFKSMPSGLIIYWSWSNFLSIIQQVAISKIVKRKKPGKL